MSEEVLVPSVYWPGDRITVPADDDWHHQRLLTVLESALEDAAVCLVLFEAAMIRSPGREKALWELTLGLSIEESRPLLDAALERRRNTKEPIDFGSIDIEARRQTIRRKAELGLLPTSYQFRIPFIHARGFLYALDVIARTLRTMSKLADAPKELAGLASAWAERFRDLTGVRDTSHHPEDRARGVDRNQKRVADFVFLENLNGTELQSTMSDGTIGTVDVSRVSLEAATEFVNNAIVSYEWSGQARSSPMP